MGCWANMRRQRLGQLSEKGKSKARTITVYAQGGPHQHNKNFGKMMTIKCCVPMQDLEPGIK